MWVKGSGGDLRTAKRENFSSLYQDKLISLQNALRPRAGARPQDRRRRSKWSDLYAQATFDLNPRASSIDTPLHSFVPFKHVDHTHPNAVISVAASKDGAALTREIYGDDMVWTALATPRL